MTRRVEFSIDASGTVTGIRRAEQMTDFTKLRAVLVARRLDEIKRLAESDMAGFITILDHLAATQAAIEALDAVER